MCYATGNAIEAPGDARAQRQQNLVDSFGGYELATAPRVVDRDLVGLFTRQALALRLRSETFSVRQKLRDRDDLE